MSERSRAPVVPVLLALALAAGAGRGQDDGVSAVRVTSLTLEEKRVDVDREMTFYRFAGVVENRLPVAVEEVVVAILFEIVDGGGSVDRHRVVARVGRVEGEGRATFGAFHEAGLSAFSGVDRRAGEGVESFELSTGEPAALLALGPPLAEPRIRAALRRALARLDGAALAALVAEATDRAPTDRYAFRAWLDRFLAEARRGDPDATLLALLDGHALEGPHRERFGEVFDSILVRVYLAEALAGPGAAGWAAAAEGERAVEGVLDLAALFEQVPAVAVGAVRAAGEAAYPALARAVLDPDRRRAADEILWSLEVHPPVRLLDATDGVTRRRVIEAFVAGGYEESLVRLGRLANEDRDRETALAAARAIVALGGTSGVVLVDLLDSPHPEVRAEAAVALEALGGAAGPPLRAALERTGDAAPPEGTAAELAERLARRLAARRADRIAARTAEARRLLDEGDAELAVALLVGVVDLERDCVLHHPVLARAHLEIGLGHLEAERPAEASHHLRQARALGADPASLDIPFYRAERERIVADLLGSEPFDLEGRRADLSAFLGPEAAGGLVADALVRAAGVRLGQERSAEALDLAERAVEVRSSPDAQGLLGRLLVAAGRRRADGLAPGATVPEFERLRGLPWAEDARREVASFHLDRAETALAGGDLDRAEAALAEAARFAVVEPRAGRIRRRLMVGRYWMTLASLVGLGLGSLLATRDLGRPARRTPAAAGRFVFGGRANPGPPVLAFVATVAAATAAGGRCGLVALAAVAGLFLHAFLVRQVRLARGREIRLEPEQLVLAGGRGRLAIPWDQIVRVSTSLPTELGLEIEDPTRLELPLPPELPQLEGHFLIVRGRYDAPLADIGELILHFQPERPA